jgi:hypothetical protein
VLAALPAFAAGPLAQIEAVLVKSKVLCGRFDQTKQLAGLKNPLPSNGRFCVLAEKGVLWRTMEPFPNTVRLTRDEIIQLRGDRIVMRLDARREPMVRTINSVLFALLAGDLRGIEALFDIDGVVHDNRWSVTLKAREPGLAKAISEIALDGGVYVASITISESGGDRTEIRFSAIETGVAAMSAAEAALF